MSAPPRFRGWFVAWTAFTTAVFAWGAGFYGPPVFLEVLHATRGILFGLGIGNLTSLPPVIAQREFDPADVGAVMALVVAINQATFALAPAVFGALRDWTSDYGTAFALAAVVQIAAALVVVSGQRVGGRSVATR